MIVINNRDDSRYFAAAQLYTARLCAKKLKNGVPDELEPSFILYEGKAAVADLEYLLEKIDTELFLEICAELSIVITDYDKKNLFSIVRYYHAYLSQQLQDADAFTVDTDGEELQASKLERILYRVANEEEELTLAEGLKKFDSGEE